MRVSAEQFEQQCKRRFGTVNPERMCVQHWEWMVRRGGSAYSARQEITPDTFTPGEPEWCFDRFGMTRTAVPDGRVICIGGEHEDSYDPDFCIYNDVIVLRPKPGTVEVTEDSGDVEIYGYPEAVFPPTDFHSATRVGDSIYLIGCLGYRGTQIPNLTPVFKVDTRTYAIEEVKTTGEHPGWIYRHSASYDPRLHAITVGKGNRYEDGAQSEPDNPLTHRLHLADFRWEIVADKLISRQYQLELNSIDAYAGDPAPENFRPRSVPHTWLPAEKCVFPIYRIDVAGICVRFECPVCDVNVTVEGNLPDDVINRILKDVATNLATSTGADWELVECPSE